VLNVSLCQRCSILIYFILFETQAKTHLTSFHFKANIKNLKTELADVCAKPASGQEMKRKIENLESLLDKARREKVPDTDEDICVAEMTREFLRCKDCMYNL